MSERKFKYFAFISYSSKNERWAKWLHSKLEHYHIPTSLCKDNPNIPEKIRPVFWYRKDLSGTRLKEALEKELEVSQYLLVICSPDSAKSEWVNDEVKSFIARGRGGYIIPFIVEGAPHSVNADEECFPESLRGLSREDEIRGISVLAEGKHHALVDVIATMFGVSFDTLWQRHKRRERNIRNIRIALCGLILFCVLGIWDYTRTKVEYYADYIDCWGLPEGITPLTREQVGHRYSSYRFEFRRVPIGERGFYKWRIHKVSKVNSKGVVFYIASDYSENIYPVQEYVFKDSYLTEIVNKDSYNRIVMRYSISADYEKNRACLYDLSGKDVRQESAYLNASTTAMNVESNGSKSKIKRFHYTRNKQGYITKVTFHANDDDNLEGSATGDNNNIYGKVFDLDSLGRTIKVTYIDHDGNPMTDKYGVGYIKYKISLFGGTNIIEYIGSDGKLTYNEHKYARKFIKQDAYGNPIEQWYEGDGGEPCYDHQNNYRQVAKYDGNGFFVELRKYDFNGNLSYCTDNYAIQRVRYDSKGRYIEASHYDINDKPCYTKSGYSTVRAKYNTDDCITEVTVYDIDDNPCVEQVYGVHKICYKYNEFNYAVEESFYNKQNTPIVSPVYHFSKQVLHYDDFHQIIRVKNYDEKGKPCFDSDFVSEIHRTYDSRGNITKVECLDIEGKLCICKDGYATITYEYDRYGNMTRECYYGTDGKSVYINMCASIRYAYYLNGLRKEDRFYDEKGELCLNDNWYAISQYEYDNNGNQTCVSFFDTDTLPCYYKDGLYSSMEFEYDNNGNVIKETFFDHKGNISLAGKMYAIGEFKYDNCRRVVECAYFDENGKPCYYDKDYHILRVRYDSKGNVTECSIFDVNGVPALSRENPGIVRYEYDAKGNLIRTDYMNAKEENVNQIDRGYSTETVSYDEANNIISRQYFDMYGKPCMIDDYSNRYTDFPITYSSLTYRYNQEGKCVETHFLDTSGGLNKIQPFAMKYIVYDYMGRIIEETYRGHDGKLAYGGNHHMSIIRYKYNRKNNYVDEILFFDTDSTLYAHIYQTVEKGVITRKEIRDAKGNLQPMNIRGFTDLKYSIMTDSINEYGQNIKRCYYGENGKLGDIEEGIAVLRNSYDRYGRVVTQEVFNENGNPVSGKTLKFHRQTNRYNEKGLIAEISCFDENNNYVNTPSLQGHCKRVYNYDERGVIDYRTSRRYFAIDGKAVDEKEVDNRSGWVEDRKEGSLLLANVELPGLFLDHGYEGLYCILEWNEWTMYDSVAEFKEVFSDPLQSEKHLLMVPVTDKGFGKIIDVTFPSGILGIKIMDYGDNVWFYDLMEVYKNYKQTKK